MTLRHRRTGAVATGLLAFVAAASCGTDDGESQSTLTPDTAGPAEVTEDEITTSGAGSSAAESTTTPVSVAATTTVTSTTSIATTTTVVQAPAALGWRTLDVVDPARTTDEVVDADGNVLVAAAAERTIPLELLYPATDGGGENVAPADVEPRPLIVWMHGLASESLAGNPVLLNLFEAGYIVAAPNSPETTFPAADASDPIEITADLSTVVDALLDPTDGVADDVAALIDGDRIGVGGHSLGSSTVVATAFHECCRDDRIDAVVASGFIPGFDYGAADFVFDETPLMMIVGAADDISPEAWARTAFDRSVGAAYLLTVDGLGHFELTSSPDTPGGREFDGGIAAFFDQYVAGVDDESMARFADELTAGTLVVG